MTALITGAAGGLGKLLPWNVPARGWDSVPQRLPTRPTGNFGGWAAPGLRRAGHHPRLRSDRPSGAGRIVRARPCQRAALHDAHRRGRGGFRGAVLRSECRADPNHRAAERGGHTGNDPSPSCRTATRDDLAHHQRGQPGGFLPHAGQGYLCGHSKRFLLDFSLALREEVRSLNATVTVLCPAGMPTNAGMHAMPSRRRGWSGSSPPVTWPSGRPDFECRAWRVKPWSSPGLSTAWCVPWAG